MSASSYELHTETRTGGSFGKIAGELQRIVTSWLARASQRRQLARLDAIQLDDIGLTQAAAMAEANKPFWQK